MTNPTSNNELLDQQQNDVCAAISNGCDRETAAKYARTTWAALHAAMSADREFAARVRRAEAAVELTHMIRLQKTSEKEANWRISVWWLESLAPDRYGPRGAGTVNSRQLKMFTEHIATTLAREVRDDGDRERLLNRLHATALQLDSFLRDECVPPELAASATILADEEADSRNISDEETE